MEENKIQKMKLYSPLTAAFFPNQEKGYECTEDPVLLSGKELREYADTIQKWIDHENQLEYWDGNLMDSFCEERNSGVQEKALWAKISVEERHGELCGCTTVLMTEPLTEFQLSNLEEYIEGQFSEGWGDGFEQRDIAVSGGMLNVYFHSAGFSFEMEMLGTVSPVSRPEMHLADRKDGNICSIMARASSLLGENGQPRQAKELRDRFFQCSDYQQALKIISEYVKLSDPPKREPKKKDRGEVR